MIIEKCTLNNIDFNTIDVDSAWNFDSRKEDKIHSIHAYPAKFPAFITKKSLDYAKQKYVKVKLVADVCCGCGTTAYEATKHGLNFWGCDINPVATLIAKVKSKNYNNLKLEEYFEKIQHYYDNASINHLKNDNINERIKYWFLPQQIENLQKLKEAINSFISSNSKYKLFFLCAFSNILKPTSKWLQKSIKPTVDKTKKVCDVWVTFENQYKKMQKAYSEKSFQSKSKSTILTADFMTVDTKNVQVDLLVTSPPYVTSYEYADLHQLSSLWLNFTNDYTKLRKGTIGSIYNSPTSIKELNETANVIIKKLNKVDKRRSITVAQYFSDMELVIRKTYNLVKNNGIAVFVIGNTEYKGVEINNAKHLVESMFAVNYRNIEVRKRKISNKTLTPYRDKAGKFSSNKKHRKIYATEFIVIGEK